MGKRFGAWALKTSGRVWYLTAAAGQIAFVAFIVRFYGSRTVSGHIERWNDKDLIKGYISGDHVGNAMFGAHALLAALITTAGLLQLVPWIRARAPWFHRWSGRAFLIVAYFMATSGLWMGWIRGARLSMASAVAISINALLIIAFATIAWRHAIAKRYDVHRAWAMRTFMVVNGVWFLRIGMMGWVLLNHGPVGIGDDLGGPVGATLAFGAFVFPLAALEAYFLAQRSEWVPGKLAAASLVLGCAAFTALGSFGAVVGLWGPFY